MIQKVIVGMLFIIILIQVGILKIDSISSLFQKDGYESDDELVYKRKRRKKRRQQDNQMTPISSIVQERRQNSPGADDPDDPEEIQRAIMSELNQHDALFLTPSPI